MPVDIEAHLSDVSVQLDRLKVLYEQYFIGIEKQPPNVARRETEKTLAFLANQNIGNTAIRFRYQTLLRRWKTYAERWDKVLREIDQGTYSRHLSRVKRRDQMTDSAPSQPPLQPASQPSLQPASQPSLQLASQPSLPPISPFASPFSGSDMTDEEDAVLAALSPVETPTPTAAKPVAHGPYAIKRPSPVPGMSDAELRTLHRSYVEALRKTGDGREVKFEALVSSLKKQVPEILKKNNCDLVAFNVTEKDGKVVLRATPKKA